MGTRGLIGHIIRGKKKATYNHFDSYPSGLGVQIAQFIQSLTPEQIERMIQNLQNVEWVDERMVASPEMRTRYAEFADLGISGQSPRDWFCLLYKTQGAKELQPILDGRLWHLIDNTDFEEDKLFCEWVYYIDWENKTVTISGGQAKEVTEIAFAELSADKMLSLERREDSDVE